MVSVNLPSYQSHVLHLGIQSVQNYWVISTDKGRQFQSTPFNRLTLPFNAQFVGLPFNRVELVLALEPDFLSLSKQNLLCSIERSAGNFLSRVGINMVAYPRVTNIGDEAMKGIFREVVPFPCPFEQNFSL
jgi:hypothetical protein